MERTLIVCKPDAVQRGLTGRILGRFERKGLKLVGLKMLQVDRALAEKIYAVHLGRDFYEPLLEFITASPVVAMVFEGQDAISVCRKLMGKTFGPDAEPGTIRGDYGISRRYNLVHGSDSAESARREIPLFFKTAELQDYSLHADAWLYAVGPDGGPL
jgi:nucleoside-diphosphate kinase